VDFSERLVRRHRVWWEVDLRAHQPVTYRAALHARHELLRRRSREDAVAAWRCCALWPRRLLNKWNSREFAAVHGAPLPELYRYCRSPRRLPSDALPDRYVIRSLLGTDAEGVKVVVDGRDLLREHPDPSVTVGRSRVGRPGFGRGACLVEQFIGGGDDGSWLPLELKCHTFAGRVAAVQVGERSRSNPRVTSQRYYWPDWSESDGQMELREPMAKPVPRPPFLQPMLELSARMGAAIGTYMRIDFLAGGSEWVFNEFSSTPMIRKLQYTPRCNELFGRMWDEACPETT
jgi:hypothetical protein